MNNEDNKKNSKKLSITEMHRLDIDTYKQSKKTPLILISDNIRSMNNVGSLFRTADCFRLEKIYLCGISPTPPHNDIHRTALGAEDSVDWEYSKNALTLIENLKNEGYKIICLEQAHSSIMLDKLTLDTNNKFALVLGNEVHGVNQEIIDIADILLEIPQFGTKHSLNVSVATGIAVWEIAKNFIPSIR